jgi:hypothetical protein
MAAMMAHPCASNKATDFPVIRALSPLDTARRFGFDMMRGSDIMYYIGASRRSDAGWEGTLI